MATPYYIGGTSGGGYGTKPSLTYPGVSQSQAISSNIGALPSAEALGGGVNQFNLGEVLKQYRAGIPGYDAMAAQSSQNILDALQGKVPSDVLSQLVQRGAERGVAMGSPGSPNANAAYLRALGLTSLGQQQYGEQALSGAVARMPKTPIYDLNRSMLTPQELIDYNEKQAIYNAAPDPRQQVKNALDLANQGLTRGYTGARSPAGDIAEKYAPPPGGGWSQPTMWTGKEWAPVDQSGKVYGAEAIKGAQIPTIPDYYTSASDWNELFGGEPSTGFGPNISSKDAAFLFDPSFTGVGAPSGTTFAPPPGGGGMSEEDLDWEYYTGGGGLPVTTTYDTTYYPEGGYEFDTTYEPEG